jgi:hypothetical protein
VGESAVWSGVRVRREAWGESEGQGENKDEGSSGDKGIGTRSLRVRQMRDNDEALSFSLSEVFLRHE